MAYPVTTQTVDSELDGSDVLTTSATQKIKSREAAKPHVVEEIEFDPDEVVSQSGVEAIKIEKREEKPPAITAQQDSTPAEINGKEIRISTPFNQFHLINQVCRECNRRLPVEGTLYGSFEELPERNQRLTRGKGKFAARTILAADFIFRRALPKLMPFRPIYKKIHLIKDRPLSKCEMFGRLAYCGFEVEEDWKNGEYIHFRARKTGEPQNGSNPYGVVIRLPRVGPEGKSINIYKLRTMHPYAQYLHRYMISNNGFDNNGKTANDYRISDWGRFLRRFFIDEIPQLFNFFKGDLRLFGVRPVGAAKYEKYPDDLKAERSKFKPGLVPPFYADMPESLEGLFDSERRYLEKRKQRPFKTDTEYFLKAVFNIIFKRAREI